MKPTKEQIQWFWEQCGIKYMGDGRWLYPDGLIHWQSPPAIDSLEFLGFLLKYAVPKLDEILDIETQFEPLMIGWAKEVVWEDDLDPALALFWAIYKALGVN